MDKEIGDNAHGFQNEKNIVSGLDGKKYKELNLNMKKFVDYIAACQGMCITYETNINARIESDNRKKQDLYISLLGKEYGVSVKMGNGNSTHQEKCEDFIDYIVDEFGASEELCDDIRIMAWCDGTLDGSGEISERMDKKEYLSAYALGIERIREFISKHEKELIERVLFVGRHNSKVDFIYHGTPISGKWISANELIDYQLNNPQPLGGALAKLGRMNLQVWNRSLTGNSDKKRGQLQIKYSSMEADLERIMHSSVDSVGTFEGDQEEFNISRVMNKNKNSSLWEIIGHKNDNERMYAVKVTYNSFSRIANQKVKAKTDAYIVIAELDDKFLLEREYIITEEDMRTIEYQVVPDTGISVKKKDSDSFTYEKLSLNSFVGLFASYLDNAKMIFCGLTLYQEEKNIALNNKIVEDLKFSIQEVQYQMSLSLGISSPSILRKEDVKAFRSYCEQKLREVIENNCEVKEMIFTGKGCFEDPYYVNYIYRNKVLSKDVIPDKYQISNGSGRSKGKYTIIFKPV